MIENYQFSDVYTRRVGGEQFEYQAQYSVGKDVLWSARVFENGELKGEPCGALTDNSLQGDALKQYIVSYIEGIIERGLGIAE
jgi:hypothetical protein